MVAKTWYMACLDLEGADCLVVGGGSVRLEKAQGLLECFARVTVVAPEVDDELRGLDVRVVERPFTRSDLVGRFLVIAATNDRSVNADVSHTGLRFTQAIGEAEKRLNDMVATFVGKVLAAQKANAGATQPSDNALIELGGARRSRTRGFLMYRFQNGAWSRSITDSPEQPSDGFTVPAKLSDGEVDILCQAYAKMDEEGRELIRATAPHAE